MIHRKKLTEKEGKQDTSMYHTSYMAHQILQNMVKHISAAQTEFSINCSMFIIILCLYVLVTLPTQISIQFLVFLSTIMTTYSLRTALRASISCHLNSKECCRIGSTTMTTNRIYNKTFWDSRQAISIAVGQEFKLETQNYILRVFGEIIPDSLTTLLLTF